MKRFSYMKSDVGEIVVAIAYEEVGDKVFYGMTCISPEERFSCCRRSQKYPPGGSPGTSHGRSLRHIQFAVSFP